MVKTKRHHMVSNIVKVIFAQAIVLIASIVKSLLIPSVLSVEDFSYWQIYVLYSGFVGVFALGYSDGFYLKYGGYDYDDLPFERLRSGNRFYLVTLVLSSVVCAAAVLTTLDGPKSFAMLFVVIDIVFTCITGLLLYVLQVTNQFGKYGFYSVFDKVILLASIVLVVTVGIADYRLFIICDSATKLIACIALVGACKEAFFGPASSESSGWAIYLEDARAGWSLLVANLAGMLAVNSGRIIVEIFGKSAEYAFFSFGMSITNLVLVFVNACALVIYPNLKRMGEESLAPFFSRVSAASGCVSALGLVMYWPSSMVVSLVFPKYSPLLPYLPLLFLAVVGQVRMQLLVNTYYKALRMERDLLRANVGSVVAVLLLGGLTYGLIHDVWWLALATSVVMLGRSWLSEYQLSKALETPVPKSLAFEALGCMAFFVASLLPDGAFRAVVMVTVACGLLMTQYMISRRSKS